MQRNGLTRKTRRSIRVRHSARTLAPPEFLARVSSTDPPLLAEHLPRRPGHILHPGIPPDGVDRRPERTQA
ncbi:hypothetical protein, partial [Methanoculleus chikugoensis]|uniref:hypothetical protein n=1 Tax=Methanoculleus chikugoensis TaxID=118126 RepID=UPI001FB4151A